MRPERLRKEDRKEERKAKRQHQVPAEAGVLRTSDGQIICPVPLVTCCKIGHDLPTDPLDGVKLTCTNTACKFTNSLVHKECFRSLEQGLLTILSNQGSARGWTESQRRHNLWEKKGLTLVQRSLRCACGKGQMVRDEEAWTLREEALERQNKKDKKKHHSKKALPVLNFSKNSAHVVDAKKAIELDTHFLSTHSPPSESFLEEKYGPPRSESKRSRRMTTQSVASNSTSPATATKSSTNMRSATKSKTSSQLRSSSVVSPAITTLTPTILKPRSVKTPIKVSLDATVPTKTVVSASAKPRATTPASRSRVSDAVHLVKLSRTAVPADAVVTKPPLSAPIPDTNNNCKMDSMNQWRKFRFNSITESPPQQIVLPKVSTATTTTQTDLKTKVATSAVQASTDMNSIACQTDDSLLDSLFMESYREQLEERLLIRESALERLGWNTKKCDELKLNPNLLRFCKSPDPWSAELPMSRLQPPLSKPSNVRSRGLSVETPSGRPELVPIKSFDSDDSGLNSPLTNMRELLLDVEADKPLIVTPPPDMRRNERQSASRSRIPSPIQLRFRGPIPPPPQRRAHYCLFDGPSFGLGEHLIDLIEQGTYESLS